MMVWLEALPPACLGLLPADLLRDGKDCHPRPVVQKTADDEFQPLVMAQQIHVSNLFDGLHEFQ